MLLKRSEINKMSLSKDRNTIDDEVRKRLDKTIVFVDPRSICKDLDYMTLIECGDSGSDIYRCEDYTDVYYYIIGSYCGNIKIDITYNNDYMTIQTTTYRNYDSSETNTWYVFGPREQCARIATEFENLSK